MKTNKKALAILTAGLLAVTPMAATGLTAFAADYDITVNNETDGYTYNAYKIFAGTLSGSVLSNVTWATKKFAANGVRDIGSFNSKMKELGNKEEILPQIVIIIDELSDLMMVAKNQVEDAVCRLADIDPKENLYPAVFNHSERIDYYTSVYGVGYKGSH